MNNNNKKANRKIFVLCFLGIITCLLLFIGIKSINVNAESTYLYNYEENSAALSSMSEEILNSNASISKYEVTSESSVSSTKTTTKNKFSLTTKKLSTSSYEAFNSVDSINSTDSIDVDDDSTLITSEEIRSSYNLLELSEVEMYNFFYDYSVEIPVEFEDNADLLEFVQSTISVIDLDPNYEFNYNYQVTQEFVDSIKKAVLEYYELDSNQSLKLYNENSISETNSSYVLQDSTLVSYTGNLDYNCYAYAIGRNENPPEYKTSKQYQPGDFSGDSYSLSVSSIASTVMADLETLGFVKITISSSLPSIDAGTNLICVRTGNYDYHFMRYDYEEDAWFHKPSFSAILKYKYEPNYKNWTNESVDQNGVAHSGTLTYDSEILYITYYSINDIFDGGNGTSTDPYLISSTKSFENIKYTATQNINYKLTSNLYYSNTTKKWTPIDEFKGTLDGNGYYFSQYEINVSDGGNLGLFKINSGVIKNLELGTRFTVDETYSNVCVGAFAGINKGKIENCSITAVYNRPFFKCYATGDSYMGCFVGSNEGIISSCTGGDWLRGSCNMGTIAGKNSGTIKSCSAGNGIQEIEFDYRDYNACVGGIVGLQTAGDITNCSFQGKILFMTYQSNEYNLVSENRVMQVCAGIIIGYKQGGTVSGCTWELPNGVYGDMVSSIVQMTDVTWTTGALWWKETHINDQDLYFRNEICGRED